MSVSIPSFRRSAHLAGKPYRICWANRMDRRLLSVALAAAVVILDRVTKDLIKAHLSLYESWTVIPGIFNIVHTENPGIAFGLLADASNYWLRSVVLIGFSVS